MLAIGNDVLLFFSDENGLNNQSNETKKEKKKDTETNQTILFSHFVKYYHQHHLHDLGFVIKNKKILFMTSLRNEDLQSNTSVLNVKLFLSSQLHRFVQQHHNELIKTHQKIVNLTSREIVEYLHIVDSEGNELNDFDDISLKQIQCDDLGMIENEIEDESNQKKLKKNKKNILFLRLGEKKDLSESIEQLLKQISKESEEKQNNSILQKTNKMLQSENKYLIYRMIDIISTFSSENQFLTELQSRFVKVNWNSGNTKGRKSFKYPLNSLDDSEIVENDDSSSFSSSIKSPNTSIEIKDLKRSNSSISSPKTKAIEHLEHSKSSGNISHSSNEKDNNQKQHQDHTIVFSTWKLFEKIFDILLVNEEVFSLKRKTQNDSLESIKTVNEESSQLFSSTKNRNEEPIIDKALKEMIETFDIYQKKMNEQKIIQNSSQSSSYDSELLSPSSQSSKSSISNNSINQININKSIDNCLEKTKENGRKETPMFDVNILPILCHINQKLVEGNDMKIELTIERYFWKLFSMTCTYIKENVIRSSSLNGIIMEQLSQLIFYYLNQFDEYRWCTDMQLELNEELLNACKRQLSIFQQISKNRIVNQINQQKVKEEQNELKEENYYYTNKLLLSFLYIGFIYRNDLSFIEFYSEYCSSLSVKQIETFEILQWCMENQKHKNRFMKELCENVVFQKDKEKKTFGYYQLLNKCIELYVTFGGLKNLNEKEDVISFYSSLLQRLFFYIVNDYDESNDSLEGLLLVSTTILKIFSEKNYDIIKQIVNESNKFNTDETVLLVQFIRRFIFNSEERNSLCETQKKRELCYLFLEEFIKTKEQKSFVFSQILQNISLIKRIQMNQIPQIIEGNYLLNCCLYQLLAIIPNEFFTTSSVLSNLTNEIQIEQINQLNMIKLSDEQLQKLQLKQNEIIKELQRILTYLKYIPEQSISSQTLFDLLKEIINCENMNEIINILLLIIQIQLQRKEQLEKENFSYLRKCCMESIINEIQHSTQPFILIKTYSIDNKTLKQMTKIERKEIEGEYQFVGILSDTSQFKFGTNWYLYNTNELIQIKSVSMKRNEEMIFVFKFIPKKQSNAELKEKILFTKEIQLFEHSFQEFFVSLCHKSLKELPYQTFHMIMCYIEHIYSRIPHKNSIQISSQNINEIITSLLHQLSTIIEDDEWINKHCLQYHRLVIYSQLDSIDVKTIIFKIIKNVISNILQQKQNEEDDIYLMISKLSNENNQNELKEIQMKKDKKENKGKKDKKEKEKLLERFGNYSTNKTLKENNTINQNESILKLFDLLTSTIQICPDKYIVELFDYCATYSFKEMNYFVNTLNIFEKIVSIVKHSQNNQRKQMIKIVTNSSIEILIRTFYTLYVNCDISETKTSKKLIHLSNCSFIDDDEFLYIVSTYEFSDLFSEEFVRIFFSSQMKRINSFLSYVIMQEQPMTLNQFTFIEKLFESQERNERNINEMITTISKTIKSSLINYDLNNEIQFNCIEMIDNSNEWGVKKIFNQLTNFILFAEIHEKMFDECVKMMKVINEKISVLGIKLYLVE